MPASAGVRCCFCLLQAMQAITMFAAPTYLFGSTWSYCQALRSLRWTRAPQYRHGATMSPPRSTPPMRSRIHTASVIFLSFNSARLPRVIRTSAPRE